MVLPQPSFIHADSSNQNWTIKSRDKMLSLKYPQVMGILNVTPDSFSDGGEFNTIKSALQRCQTLLNQGASLIDIGGESTRPNAAPVSTEEEIRRVVPVVQAIRQEFGDAVWLSIDTSNPDVMRQAWQAGADIWNDVRALKRPNALATAVELGVPVVLMHMRGEPDTMNDLANYEDVVQTVMAELDHCVQNVIAAGIDPQNLILDLGFGFAKKYQHNLILLKNLAQFQRYGLPILVGVSRKRFLGEVLNSLQTFSGDPMMIDHAVKDRDAVGMAAAVFAVQQGAHIIRTHNVAMTVQGLAILQAMM